jgi:hypothetical protein
LATGGSDTPTERQIADAHIEQCGAQSSPASEFGADDEQNMDLFIGCYRATAYRRIAVMNLMSLSITKYGHNGVIWPSYGCISAGWRQLCRLGCEEHGDLKRLTFLPMTPWHSPQIVEDAKTIQVRRGKPSQMSGCSQAVMQVVCRFAGVARTKVIVSALI